MQIRVLGEELQGDLLQVFKLFSARLRSISGRFFGQIFEQMFGQVFFTRVLARVLTRVWGREKPCTQCTVLPGLRKNMQRPQKPSKTSNASPP